MHVPEKARSLGSGLRSYILNQIYPISAFKFSLSRARPVSACRDGLHGRITVYTCRTLTKLSSTITGHPCWLRLNVGACSAPATVDSLSKKLLIHNCLVGSQSQVEIKEYAGPADQPLIIFEHWPRPLALLCTPPSYFHSAIFH